MDALTHILQHKIVAIVRGVKPADMIRLAETLYSGGIKTPEASLVSPRVLAHAKTETDRLTIQKKIDKL